MKKASFLIWPQCILLALAAYLRIWNLGTRPFDGDEGVVLKIASQSSLKAVFHAAAADVHPPLVHWVTFFVKRTVGLTEFTARFFPALAGVGAIYFIYQVLRRLFNEKIALLGAFCSTISAVLIYSAAEARFYSFLTFFFFGALYFALKIKEKDSFINWLWLTIFAIGLVYSQHLGWFLLLGLAVMILWGKNFRKNIGKLFVSLATILLAYLPQLAITVSQIQGRVAEQPLLVSLKTNLIGIFNAFYRFAAGRIYLDLSPSISTNLSWAKANPWEFALFLATLLIPAAIFIIGIIRTFKYKKAIVALSFIIFGVILALFISEIGSKASRYLIFLAPLYYGYLASGIVYLWFQKIWGKILVLAVIAVFIWGLVNYYSFTIKAPGENKVAMYIAQNLKPDEAILTRGAYGGGETFALDYYWPKDAAKPETFDFFGRYKAGNLAKLKAANLGDKIAEILLNHSGCWYYDFTYSKDSDDLAAKKQVHQINLGNDKEGKPIKIWLYERGN